MVDFTPRGLPYPEVTDRVADGWEVIRDLAEAVDTQLASLATGLAAVTAWNAGSRLSALEAVNSGSRLSSLETSRTQHANRLTALELVQNGSAVTTPVANNFAVNIVRKFASDGLVIVVLRFDVNAGAAGSADSEGKFADTALASIPSGFRPPSAIAWHGYASTDAVACGGRIDASGNVRLEWMLPNADLAAGADVYVQAAYTL